MKKRIVWVALLFPVFVLPILSCRQSSERDDDLEGNTNRSFKSNGEQIYFTARSQRGDPITSEMIGMMHMQGGQMACVDCHGSDGKGKSVSMMMGSFKAPDIRYKILTSPEHVHHEEQEPDAQEMHHPPYSNESIKRAITQGIDPAGNYLKTNMPRWRMSDADLDDLINFLKTFD